MNENTTGNKLKALREYAEYTPERLAQFLKCSPQQVIQWENGELEPTLNQWMMLCKLYGITPDEMFSHINADNLVDKDVRDEFMHEASVNHILKRNQYL
ncbi:helix-turn-helix transcriptional regulator [Porcipelethomonas sp.]|uniref:helix-turn-helix transcriptional regulator n=1 Tax=Porcipelethomonas sp. TaxID=2981675 RepID=UPI003EFB2228